MRSVSILGSTGSIGKSVLDILVRHPDLFKVRALSAHRNIQLLLAQAERFKPELVVVSSDTLTSADLAQLRQTLPAGTRLEAGAGALIEMAAENESDTLVAAIVGAAGLLPTLAAVDAGKRVLLANKEALVCAGRLFMRRVRERGAELLPIDSEHNAIFQCWPDSIQQKRDLSTIRRIILTASGGPFRTLSAEALRSVTPAQAFAHPNWDMGQKISVDSATMMNKGLEVIEARWLFDLEPERIDVVVHPQSILHSLVEFADGSQLAQLGNPDMRIPIASVLAYPHRIESGAPFLDLTRLPPLTFEEPDFERFRCLKLAADAVRAGGSAPIVLNAVNEIAVQSFISGRIGFMQIAQLVEKALESSKLREPETIEEVLDCDLEARSLGQHLSEAMH